MGLFNEHLFNYRWGHGNAGQVDRLLRTTPEPYFAIMDEHLAQGGLTLARPESIVAHQAHSGEDAVMRSISSYILQRHREIPAILAETSPARLLASYKIQRYRVTTLLREEQGGPLHPHASDES